jgi:hypothetical protein
VVKEGGVAMVCLIYVAWGGDTHDMLVYFQGVKMAREKHLLGRRRRQYGFYVVLVMMSFSMTYIGIPMR